jgi:hypothetical protein
MDDSRSEDKTSFGIGLILLIFAIGIVDLVWGDRRGEDKTSFRIGLILRDFCYLIAIVVSCCLIMVCRILIVVSGYCICCLVIVSCCGVAYRILIVVSGYRIGCLAMVSYCYRSLLLSYWPCSYGSPLLSYCLSCYGIVVYWVVFLMLVLTVVSNRETRHRENTFLAETTRKPSSNRRGWSCRSLGSPSPCLG